jgi:hypothetical protein
VTIKKNALSIILVNSTQATTHATLARKKKFVVEHSCILCDAIRHARTGVRSDVLGEKAGEVHQKMG